MMTMLAETNIRAPQVAGQFYPADRESCAQMVEDCLNAAPPNPVASAKAIIAPHAGHIYSGPVAATVYKSLISRKKEIRRVVLVGIAHRVPFKGIATTTAAAWASPLGEIAIDGDGVAAAATHAGVTVFEGAFAGEHSLEVQLPFLQTVLEDFTLVPLIVGDAGHAEVAAVLDVLWGGPETLIVISSDLSHFHDYATAQKLDAATRGTIEALEPGRLDGAGACGHRAVGGALLEARKRDLRVTGVDIRNSGDTRGGRDRVVGYGSFTMEYAASARLPEAERQALLDAARQSIVLAAREGVEPKVKSWQGIPETLKAIRGTFVTLKIGGRLRGCVGSMAPHRPLLADVVANAFKAGYQDRRFQPLSAAELDQIDVEISVLSHARPMVFADEEDLIRQLRPDVDGVVLADGGARGLFLPSVWESLPRAEDFLGHLKRKAGLPANHWSPELHAFRFTAEKFGMGYVA